ncbi:MAG: DUF3383 family protein [Deltaproteobacteria bacterium]|nr:DUF3383 family protein [Deltaproteobacteria bacterium]
MSLSDIASVTITTATRSISRVAFDIPLLAAYVDSSIIPGRVQLYGSLPEMVAAGHAVTDPAYLMAQAMKSQNPSIKTWKVGRRALPAQQSIRLTPTITTEGEVLSINVDGTEISYTILGGASVATIVTALHALVNAIATVTSTDDVTHLTIAPTTTNDLLAFGAVSVGFKFEDLTPDPGIVTDLAAIEAEDPSFYGLLIDSNSEAEINAAAVWAEARNVLFGASTMDTLVKDVGTTTDVASDLKAAAYARTFLLFGEYSQQYPAARWMGNRFPYDPGSTTWKFKTLAGLTVSELTAAETSALAGKNCNYYLAVAGVNITSEGYSSSGEFIDITRGVDWYRVRQQERVFFVLVSNGKLPFDDETGDIWRGVIQAQFDEGVRKGVFLPDTEDTPQLIIIPLAADVSAANKALRVWPDMEASAYLAGAVHATVMSVSLSL